MSYLLGGDVISARRGCHISLEGMSYLLGGDVISARRGCHIS